MLKLQEVLGFNNVFSNEDYRDYLLRFNEIPKDLLIRASTHLLSFNRNDTFITNHTELLSLWFSVENNQLANEINQTINDYIQENPKDIVIINSRSSLNLFEKILSSQETVEEITNSDFEVLLFKIYLALNEELNEKENILIDTLENNNTYPKTIRYAIGSSLPTFDIINYDLNTILLSQFLRSIFLFEFLVKRDDTVSILNAFYQRFNVNNYKEFLKKLFPISLMIINAQNQRALDIVVKRDGDFESNTEFLDNLIVNNIESNNSTIDFLNIRANPLYKMNEETYRIIFSLFAIEKNFNGLYFILKEINDNLPRAEKIELRQIITFDFSEKYMLYSLLENTYKNKYFKLSGEQMSTPGAPDYYIRNGNKTFIFESKDILINASVKDSYDFNQYESALKDKLYFHNDGNTESPKAVQQLARFSKKLLNGSFQEDSSYKPKSIKIYPILVLHNRQLDIAGLNNLINIWFEEEINKMVEENVDIKNLRKVTIINIDTLILYQEQLESRELKFEALLDDYQKWIDEESLKKKKFKNEDEIKIAIQDQMVSFNMYMLNKYSWKLNKTFKEKGFSLLQTPSA